MRSLTRLGQRRELTGTTYQLTDCLHHRRTVYVSADGIAYAVSAWLAERGAHSPLVEDLARTVRDGDGRPHTRSPTSCPSTWPSRPRHDSGAELDRYWPHLVALWPAYREHYERSDKRRVFVLEPVSSIRS